MACDVTDVRESIFMCGPEGRLLGVVSEGELYGAPDSRIGVIFLNAGNTHRVGPNRLYVMLSRALARMEFVCCRFDFSGIGDSPARLDGLGFRDYALQETCMVMDDMERRRGVETFILVGICAGADVAFDAAAKDDRVSAVVLINGAFVDGEAFAAAYHKANRRTLGRLYLRRLFSLSAWARLLTLRSRFWTFALGAIKSRFKSRGSSVSKPANSEPTGGGSSDKWRTMAGRGVKVLMVYSEGSVFRDMFRLETAREIRAVYPPQDITVVMQKDTDHTFTLVSSRNTLTETVLSWLEAHTRKETE